MPAIKHMPSPRVINAVLSAPAGECEPLHDEAGSNLGKHTVIALLRFSHHGPRTSYRVGTLQ